MRSALSLSIAIGNECTADINVLENFIEFPKQFIETNVSSRWNFDRDYEQKIVIRYMYSSRRYIQQFCNIHRIYRGTRKRSKGIIIRQVCKVSVITITGTTRMENGKCVINSRTFARGSIHSMNVNLPTWCWSVFSQNPKFKHDDGRGWSDKGSTKTR